MSSSNQIRYQRQTILPGFGVEGQQKLRSARVLVAGAGGLGCPVLQYLAAAGVGSIGIADFDIVSLSNLHRQVLFSSDDIGLSKATRAADILSQLNTEIDIKAHHLMIGTTNIINLLQEYDIVVDGTDNFATRYLINDACCLMRKTLVHGAVSQFEGQLAVFNYTQPDGTVTANYRDLFPEPPNAASIPNCEQAGVLGVLPGIIGSMMANEVIKLLTGLGKLATNRLITFNTLYNNFYELNIVPGRSDGMLPFDIESFKTTDYATLCGEKSVHEITPEELFIKISTSRVVVVDVRENENHIPPKELNSQSIPLSKLKESLQQLEHSVELVFICQNGITSTHAAKIANDRFGETKQIHHLKGGIVAWNAFNSDQL